MIEPDRLLRQAAHRPWPLPRSPWMMFQSWQSLLFAHWRLPPEALRPLVPDALELDLRDGAAWLGMTPFRLSGLRVRPLPPIPGVSEFPELNLRTYVRAAGKPGIFFFTLEAGSRLAVRGARTLYRLPYHHASMSMFEEAGWIRFESRRPGGVAAFRARYRPTGAVFRATDGSLEAFLTERYALFTVLRNGRVLRGDIHHPPWPLQTAEGEVQGAGLAGAYGIALPDGPPLLHFSRLQDTLVWPPTPHP